MKESNLTFAEGFMVDNYKAAKEKGNKMMAFDWDKAAKIIKDLYKKHKDLMAEAGLQGDYKYTGNKIFTDGSPTNKGYTYLTSNWATPTLFLSWDSDEQKEIPCFTTEESRFNFDSKWDKDSLKILGIKLPK